MAAGMNYLHSKSVLHRDLKSQNIWLDGKLGCKIGDFGMSRMNSQRTMTLCGSPLWCSPEILESKHYSYGADTYSFAIILWEIFHWYEPYQEYTVMEIIMAVTQPRSALPYRNAPFHRPCVNSSTCAGIRWTRSDHLSK